MARLEIGLLQALTQPVPGSRMTTTLPAPYRVR
jgi:hypothetical protein